MASIHVKEPLPEEEVTQEPAERVEPEQNSVPVPEEAYQPSAHVRPMISSQTKLVGVAAVILLVVSGAIIFNLISDRKELKQEVSKLSSSNTQNSQNDANEAEQLKEELSSFIELPADETPTVATVTDASKVKNQSFFANAENNDKVLLFAKAGKAILYRPSTKKIIEVAPINLNNTESQQGSTTPQTNTNR